MKNIKEFLIILESLSYEKSLDKDLLYFLFCETVSDVMKKQLKLHKEAIVETVIDDNYTVKSKRVFNVVDQINIDNIEFEMLASEIEDEEIIKDKCYENIDFEYTRNFLNQVKQVLIQKIESNSKKQVLENLKIETNVLGKISNIKKDGYVVEYKNVNIFLPKINTSSLDKFKIGDNVLFAIEKNNNGYFATRKSDTFILNLIKKEIPQIEDGDIDIVSISRIPGYKTKVLIKSHIYAVNPVKICLGHNGLYLNNIKKGLNQENIDFIKFDFNITQQIINSLKPFVISSINIDEENKKIEISMAEDTPEHVFSKTNSVLLSNLLNWKINIIHKKDWDLQKEIEERINMEILIKILNIDENQVNLLNTVNVKTYDDVYFLDEKDVKYCEGVIPGFSENRKEFIYKIDNTNFINEIESYSVLRGLGLLSKDIEILKEHNIKTIKDFSELSGYEVEDMLNYSNELCCDWINKSRQLGLSKINSKNII